MKKAQEEYSLHAVYLDRSSGRYTGTRRKTFDMNLPVYNRDFRSDD